MFFRRSEDDTFLYSIFSHNIYRLCLGEMMATSALIQTEAGSAGAKSFFYVVLLALITAILCLLFGFDTAVINSVLLFIRHEFALNNLQTETAASSLLLGCLIGKAAASLIGDRLRRKLSLILASLVFAISTLGAALSNSVASFVYVWLYVPETRGRTLEEIQEILEK